jgi:hypothetical protein
MAELSQHTLELVIEALDKLPPDSIRTTYSNLGKFWRTKMFGAGFPNWSIEFVLKRRMDWSVIVPDLFHGKVTTAGGTPVADLSCDSVLTKLTNLALSETRNPTRATLLAAIRRDGFSTERVSSVSAPKPAITSATVEAALRDAETLIHTSGAPNALDRVHTAFHGWLERVCEEADIPVNEDAPITTLFAQIRSKHPKLKISDAQADQMMVQVTRGLAQVVDALNPIRNNKTLAHPNPLLDEAEAMLAVNAIRTMLHYLDKRLA